MTIENQGGKEYWVMGADQRMYGPASMEMLVAWVEEERITPETRIAKHNTADWREATTYPELAAALQRVQTKFWAAQPLRPAGPPQPYMDYERAGPMVTNQLAAASLVMGIVGLACCTILLSPLAIVFGGVAHAQIAKSGGRQKGKGMATAGIVLGVIGLLMSGLWFAWSFARR